MQRVEEDRFAELNCDENLPKINDEGRNGVLQEAIYVVKGPAQELPVIGEKFGRDTLLIKKSGDPGDGDFTASELLEEAAGDITSSPRPPQIVLPELNFSSLGLRMSMLMPDINIREGSLQTESPSGRANYLEQHQNENATNAGEPSRHTVALTMSTLNRKEGESCLSATNSMGTVANNTSGVEHPPSAMSDRRVNSEKTLPNIGESSTMPRAERRRDSGISDSSVTISDVSSDESLFSDLTSLANTLRRRANSSTLPAISENHVKIQPRDASPVRHIRSNPHIFPAASYSPTLDSRVIPKIVNTRPYAMLHDSGASPRPPVVNGVPIPSPDRFELLAPVSFLNFKEGQSPPPKFNTYDGNCHELSSHDVPEGPFHPVELPAPVPKYTCKDG